LQKKTPVYHSGGHTAGKGDGGPQEHENNLEERKREEKPNRPETGGFFGIGLGLFSQAGPVCRKMQEKKSVTKKEGERKGAPCRGEKEKL